MRRLLREPLLHFLILGALLFALYGWLNKGLGAPDEIVLSRGQLASLQSQFSKVWQREPTAEERKGLIDSWVREEVLYREGQAMGLDRDDPVIRRRVVQKIEFLGEGTTPEVPSEQALQAWLDAHADDYRLDPRYTLKQVYFDPSRHGERFEADVGSALAVLENGKPVVGDSTMLPSTLDNVARTDVVRVFGDQFADALADLKEGEWSAPLRSGFGIHLVRIDKRQPGRVARLDEVRQAVERDLLHDRTRKASDAYYQGLLKQYTVRIEDAGEAGKAAVQAQ